MVMGADRGAEAGGVQEGRRMRNESIICAIQGRAVCSDAQSRREDAACGSRRSRRNRVGQLFAMMAPVRERTNKGQEDDDGGRG